MRSPAFASAGVGPCAGVQTLMKCPQFPNVSKLTSHILSNSEADSSSLAVRDTLQSRCGNLLWRITGEKNLVKPVSLSAKQQPGSKCEHGLVSSLLHTGGIVQNSLFQGSVYCRGMEPQCVFWLRTATSSH